MNLIDITTITTIILIQTRGPVRARGLGRDTPTRVTEAIADLADDQAQDLAQQAIATHFWVLEVEL